MSAPPTSVTFACSFFRLSAYLSTVAGVLVLVMSGISVWPLGALGIGLGVVLMVMSRRLWHGDRYWWLAALVLLGLAAVVGVLRRDLVTVVVAPPMLACLLTPAARRYYRPAAVVVAAGDVAGEEAPGGP